MRSNIPAMRSGAFEKSGNYSCAAAMAPTRESRAQITIAVDSQRAGVDSSSVLLRKKCHEPLECRAFAELVVQQPLAVIGDDHLHVHALREERGERACGVHCPAR